MKRKRLIIISSIVAGLIVVMGVVGGSVWAASTTTSTSAATNPESIFAAKVATILGIDQAKVEAAFTQAQKEMRTDAENSRLAKMVADGTITQEQADQYKAWLASQPDVPALNGPRGGRGMMGPGFGCPPGGQRPELSSTSTTN
jgi:hypothetical protein